MTHSKHVTRTAFTDDYSSREGARVTGIQIHHGAATSFEMMLDLQQPGGRTVSSNYVVKDKNIAVCVPEEYRAWTSGSGVDDRRMVTFEITNEAGDPWWSVSDDTMHSVAKVMADASLRHSFPLNDDTVITHQELWTRFGRSYPTACPGDLQRRKGELIQLANKYRSAAGESTTIPSKEIEVKTYHYQDPGARGGGRVLQPGKHLYLHKTKGVANDKASNVVGGVGAYSITPHVYAAGQPGDVVEVTLMWAATKKPGAPLSPHYTERATIDRDGLVMVSREFKRGVGSGDAVYVRVRSAATNSAPVNVTVLDCDAYLYLA